MRNNRIWARILGVEKTVVEAVETDEDQGCVVVSVRPSSRARSRCGMCRRRCPGYDNGPGRRRWRALDAGLTSVFIEARTPRVSCVEHGVVVAAVPWARHGPGTPGPSMRPWPAGDALFEERGVRADADRLAHGRFHRRSGMGGELETFDQA